MNQWLAKMYTADQIQAIEALLCDKEFIRKTHLPCEHQPGTVEKLVTLIIRAEQGGECGPLWRPGDAAEKFQLEE
tara:strand:+ start:1577 stop:1801 length:225 start_codon:yes stop_codon:yes gene_type:complete